jgi:hypothetical protein
MDAPLQGVEVGFSAILPDINEKKPTWPNTRQVFDHVGLLDNGPPGMAGLPFS